MYDKPIDWLKCVCFPFPSYLGSVPLLDRLNSLNKKSKITPDFLQLWDRKMGVPLLTARRWYCERRSKKSLGGAVEIMLS